MTKWEYKTITVLFGEVQELNKAGEEGWELVCVMYALALLKRPITSQND